MNRFLQLSALVALVVLVVCLTSTPAGAQSACQTCHSAPGMGEQLVTQDTLKGSAHEGLECRQCHTGMPTEPVMHSLPAPPPNCMGCHGAQSQPGAASIDPVRHGVANAPKGMLPTCWSCHGDHQILPSGNPESGVSRQNIVQTCATCHGPDGAAAKLIGDKQVIDYRQSVHGQPSPDRPGLYPAVCTDCHGEHVILPEADAASPVNKRNVPQTCGKCHEQVYQKFSESIHGTALAQGIEDAPSCTDCHGEHKILGANSPDSPVSEARVSETCAGCHDDMTLIRKYDLPVGRGQSYRRSYHGVANRYGQIEVASCVSCHRAHMILPQDDARSSIHPANLQATCGTENCHPGVGANVTKGSIHITPSPTSDAVIYWVELLYTLFIWVLITSFVLMIILDLVQHGRRGWKAHAPLPERPLDKVHVRRFTKNQLWQHWLLITSFTLLLLTGFPVRFADWATSEWVVTALGGMTLRGNLHRLMAIVLIAVCVWHVLWTVLTRQGRADFVKMLPVPKDIPRAIGMVKYYIGLAPKMPAFGRFNLIEKFEYLAMGWGSAVMILTGFPLWFPEWALTWMPKWGLDICHVVHGYEAVLAFLAITIWHFYHVHFKPGMFPMSRVWLTGEVELAEMRHEHRDEYDLLTQELERQHPEGGLAEATPKEVQETARELEEQPVPAEERLDAAPPEEEDGEPEESAAEQDESAGTTDTEDRQ